MLLKTLPVEDLSTIDDVFALHQKGGDDNDDISPFGPDLLYLFRLISIHALSRNFDRVGG